MSVEVELEARIVRSQSHRTVEFGDAGPNRPLPYCSIVGKECQLGAFEFGTQGVVFTRANLEPFNAFSRFYRDISVSVTLLEGMFSAVALYRNAELGIRLNMPHHIEEVAGVLRS